MTRHHSILLAALLLLGAGCATAGRTVRAPASRPTPTPGSLPPLSGSGGGRIAFTSNRDGDYELYIMNADGSDVRQLTHNPYEDRGPVWSPDGNRICLQSSPEGQWDIYTMNANGSAPQRLTSDPANDTEPA